MHPFQHILVPTDFAEPAERAVNLAAALGAVVGARLTILHVVTTEALHLASGASLPLDALVAEAESLLRDHVVEVEDHGVEAEGLLAFGDPTTEILAAIESREADLVVMGTHGGRGRARLLLGSVTEEIVRRSKVPAVTASSHVRAHDWLLRSAPVPRLRSTPPLGAFAGRTFARSGWFPAND